MRDARAADPAEIRTVEAGVERQILSDAAQSSLQMSPSPSRFPLFHRSPLYSNKTLPRHPVACLLFDFTQLVITLPPSSLPKFLVLLIRLSVLTLLLRGRREGGGFVD